MKHIKPYLKALIPIYGIWWAVKQKDDTAAKAYLVWANVTLSVGMTTITYLLNNIKP
jgi:hypothetical protein